MIKKQKDQSHIFDDEAKFLFPFNLQKQIESTKELLRKFFKEEWKVEAWMDTPNLNLGGSKPIDLIKAGRGNKLTKFLESEIEDSGISESNPTHFSKLGRDKPVNDTPR